MNSNLDDKLGSSHFVSPLDQSKGVTNQLKKKFKGTSIKVEHSDYDSHGLDHRTSSKYNSCNISRDSVDKIHSEVDNGVGRLLEETSNRILADNMKQDQLLSSRAKRQPGSRLPLVPLGLSIDCDVPTSLNAAMNNNYMLGRDYLSNDKESSMLMTLLSNTTKNPPLKSLSSDISRNASRDNLCLWGQYVTPLSPKSYSLDFSSPSTFESPSRSILHSFSSSPAFSPCSTFSSFSRNSSFERSPPTLSPQKNNSKKKMESGSKSSGCLPQISPTKKKSSNSLLKNTDVIANLDSSPNGSVVFSDIPRINSNTSGYIKSASHADFSQLNSKKKNEKLDQKREVTEKHTEKRVGRGIEKEKDDEKEREKKSNNDIIEVLAECPISVTNSTENVRYNVQIIYNFSDQKNISIRGIIDDERTNLRGILDLLENKKEEEILEEKKEKILEKKKEKEEILENTREKEEIKVEDVKKLCDKEEGKKKKDKTKVKDKHKKKENIINSYPKIIEKNVLIEHVRRMIPIQILDLELMRYRNIISKYIIEEENITDIDADVNIITETLDLDSILPSERVLNSVNTVGATLCEKFYDIAMKNKYGETRI